MSWTPEFHVGDGSIVCEECLAEDPEDYLRSLEGECTPQTILRTIDLAAAGYVSIDDMGVPCSEEDSERSSLSMSPKRASTDLLTRGVGRFILAFAGRGTDYTVWVHESEVALADGTPKEDPNLKVEMPENEYRDLADENAGICLACGAIDDSGDYYEPDARGRKCGECGAKCACGVEWAMMSGVIEVTDSE
jgi:hypothetical protein